MTEERRNSRVSSEDSVDLNDREGDDQSRGSNPLYGLLGECRFVYRWLAAKPNLLRWLPLKLLDAVLRGFSQVVFANNTISGLFVLIGLAVGDPVACAAGLLAASLAALTALIFNQSWNAISNGLVTYNGVLVGTVVASICPAIIDAAHGPAYIPWCLIALGGIISALLTSSLANLLKGASLPAMTVPFNLIGVLIFVCLSNMLKHFTSVDVSVPADDLAGFDNSSLDWLLVMKGSFVSMGQIYAVESIACSAILYVGILLYSPLLCISLYIGSFLGSIYSLLVTDSYAAVYSGLWGYNPALTCAAVAVVFYVPTLLSCFNALMAVIFTVAAQLAFSSVMGPAGLPVLTIPFVVTCAIFLAVSSGEGAEKLVKVPDGQPPEYQRKRYNRQRRFANTSPSDI